MSVKIDLRKRDNAGMYDLVVSDNGISESMKRILCGGQPWDNAYRDAEGLAIALDCSLYLDGELIRLAQRKENRSYSEVKRYCGYGQYFLFFNCSSCDEEIISHLRSEKKTPKSHVCKARLRQLKKGRE